MGEPEVHLIIWQHWGDFWIVRAFVSRGRALAMASILNRYCTDSGFKEFTINTVKVTFND